MKALLKKKLLLSDSDNDLDSDLEEYYKNSNSKTSTKYKSDSDSNKSIKQNSDSSTSIKKNINTKVNLKDLKINYNSILKKYWGYESLKEEQFLVIKKILIDKIDICAVLATGFGKSVCYQLPFLISNQNVIVVSPLIALMHEQSLEMEEKNINVCVFNSEKTNEDKENIMNDIINGNPKLIYMTPEYLIKSERFIKKIKNNLAMICIDEAHAVSTWGLDFRPSYTKLGVIREWVPKIPILTLTATASLKVRQDITEILGLIDPQEIIGNFDRPNLKITVESRQEDIMINIKDLLQKYKNEYIIIYCKTRNETDELSIKIQNLGINCESYHAGLSDKKRSDVQFDFINGTCKCMIATIAFGMGINIPKVRLVIHYNCPKNIESYYQEIGRAGRDGLPSECYLYYSIKDFHINRYFLQTIKNPIQKNYQEEQIRLIEKYVYSVDCRRKNLLINFGQVINSCNNCDNCLLKINNVNLKPIKKVDYTQPIYILLNTLYRIDNKFGMMMTINILLGKSSKIKKYMIEYSEFNTGISFGNDIWWKELFRFLINDDIIHENQISGGFGITISITPNGKKLLKKLNERYNTYKDLLISKNDEDYKKYRILYNPIVNKKKSAKSSVKKNNIKINNIKIDNIKIVDYDADDDLVSLENDVASLENDITSKNNDL